MEWMRWVTSVVLIGSMIFLAVMIFFCFLRSLIGPRIADRIVAVNMIGTQIIILICLLAVYLEEGGLVDMAIIYAMFSFLAVVFFTRVYIGVYNERHMKKEEEAKHHD